MMRKDRLFEFSLLASEQHARTLRKALSFLLVSSLILPSLQVPVSAQQLDLGATKPVHGQVSISREVAITPSADKVTLNLRDANVRDVLNMLAAQGKFNLIMDESVTGTLTIDIRNIPINKALEYIFTVNQLSYTKDGNTVIVAAQEAADERNLTTKSFKAIPVQYKNAAIVAGQLSSTILKVQRPGGSTSALVAADADSNSLLVMGTDADMRLIADALRELDVPRNRKVYHIKHNTPSYVAQVLAANFFNSANGNANGGGAAGGAGGGAAGGAAGGAGGGAAGGAGGGAGGGAAGGAGGAGGGAGGGAAGGAGGAGGGAAGGAGGGAAGGAGGGAGGGAAGGAGGAAGGAGGGAAPTLNTFNIGGVTFIAEPVSATLTVLGTDEQLSLIDSIIEQVDIRRPQVAIEVSLVEIQDSVIKNLVPNWTGFNFGRVGRLQLLASGTAANVVQLANPFNSNQNQFPKPTTVNNGLSVAFQNQNLRGKILANPTIVTMDQTAANISITDQVPTISQTNTIVNGVSTITTTITTQDAGVTVDLTPQIFNDGSVLLNLQPNVSQPVRTVEAVSGSGASATVSSTVLLATRSMNLAGVRVRDGETLVIGGLLRETAQTDIRKVPGLDKLPIVSAMFRSSNNNQKDKTELVLMVTPHILKEEAITYFDQPHNNKPASMNQGFGGMQPVSLPKYIGPMSDNLQQPAEQPLVPATHQEPTGVVTPQQSGSNQGNPASLPRVGQTLKTPKRDTVGNVLQTTITVQEALKMTPPKVQTPAKLERVYEKPAPKPQLLELMDEILKN